MYRLRCFVSCVTTFDSGSLDSGEKKCVKNCLKKYRDSESVLIEKMYVLMRHHVMSDANLKAHYAKKGMGGQGQSNE